MLVGDFFILYIFRGGFPMAHEFDKEQNAFLSGPIFPPLIRFTLPLIGERLAVLFDKR